eukprot:1548806-Alexandrium_andersonii.AAC.1
MSCKSRRLGACSSPDSKRRKGSTTSVSITATLLARLDCRDPCRRDSVAAAARRRSRSSSSAAV